MSDEFLLRRSAQMAEEDPAGAKEAFHAAAEAATPPCPSCGKVIRHRGGLVWCEDNEMSESNLQTRVRNRAKTKGWHVAHAGRGYVGEGGGWLTPMLKGWPDLTLFKPGHRIIFIELKRQTGEVSEEQLEVLRLLNQTGNYAIVIRPVHLRDGTVKAILRDGAPL